MLIRYGRLELAQPSTPQEFRVGMTAMESVWSTVTDSAQLVVGARADRSRDGVWPTTIVPLRPFTGKAEVAYGVTGRRFSVGVAAGTIIEWSGLG